MFSSIAVAGDAAVRRELKESHEKGIVMHTGRNELCPCGSGKKYKKCCLLKDREVAPNFIPPSESRTADTIAEDAAIALRDALKKLPPLKSSVAPRPPEPVDPLMEAINERWGEFEDQDYEGQVSLFVKTLDDEALMDSEMAFEMLNQLYDQSRQRADADRFDILAHALRERRPNIFAENAIYIVPWLISNALVARRWEEVQRLALEVAAIADKNVDLFTHLLDELAYHGQLATLVEMMHIAWPRIKDSHDVMGWAIDEFANRAVGYEIFAYVENVSSPINSDPALIERLEFYAAPVSQKDVAQAIDELTGRTSRTWTLADFNELQSRPMKSRDWDDDAPKVIVPPNSNLLRLTEEFVEYLRRVEGVPYSRAELGRFYLTQYLRRRAAGDLEPQESMLDSMLRPAKQKQNRNQKPAPRKFEHLLCPDRETMDRFLAGLTRFMVSRYHALAATMELVPAWLRFLESRQLLDAPQRIKTMKEFTKLRDDVLKLVSTINRDPSLRHNLEAAWPNVLLPVTSQ